jgi:RNA polymerase sigma-70 factor, ECF subfamily
VPHPSDDRELLARARGGDLDAFADFIRRHEARVRSVVSRLLDDPRDAEEATQDVFVQAWRSAGRFRGEAAVSTWLYRIAVNEALMRTRRKRPATVELEETIAATDPSAADLELRAVLLRGLRELPPDYRVPLVLRDIGGLTNDEVAAVLGLSLAAAKSRIHRARMAIRAALEAFDDEGGQLG